MKWSEHSTTARVPVTGSLLQFPKQRPRSSHTYSAWRTTISPAPALDVLLRSGSGIDPGCTMLVTMDWQKFEACLRRDPKLVAVWEMLGRTRSWVVGGWIRDCALGRKAADLDLVVADTSEEGIHQLASALGLKAHRLGQPGRQCWLMAPPKGRSIEIPGEKGPQAGISKIEIWELGELSLEQDVLRRDFSINGLLWELPKGPLIDLSSGLEDLDRRQLRAIRKENFIKDPLRLLRAPRLLSGLPGFRIEEETRSWIRKLAPLLASAPPERIGAEFLKICTADRPIRGLASAEELGLLDHCLEKEPPPADPAPWSAMLDLLDRGRPVRKAASRPESCLGWIAARLQIETPGELSSFCWPKERALSAFLAARDRKTARELAGANWRNRREALFRWGQAFPAVFALGAAEDLARGGGPEKWRRWWRQYQDFTRQTGVLELPLRAEEISEICRIKPGPELGHLIHQLRMKMIRREILSRSAALRWLRRCETHRPD